MRKILPIFCLLISLCAYAGTDSLALRIPRTLVGKPLLFGSRIIDVNRSYGKVFSPGQRNPFPRMVKFDEAKKGGMLVLKSIDSLQFRSSKRTYFNPVLFHIVRETPEDYYIDISAYFASYPPAISVIPPKMLDGPAEYCEFLDTRMTDRYIQISVRYRYENGIDVTAACYFVFLSEEPMQPRTIPGYNGVQVRRKGHSSTVMSHRWNLSPGKTIDFYVDDAFPQEWYPYIKEGIEDWNRAFRRIGLGDVLRVHPEPADSSFDRNSPLVNMVRYMDVDESNAKGDVLVDDRSGEVLHGDIIWWKDVLGLICGWRYVQTGAADAQARALEYPVEVLGPMIRHAICHEMGHALGLGHNMGASWAYPTDSLRSVSFTQKYGTAASVMDYARYNHIATAADVAAGVSLMPPRLGPYDYYAIALGYGEETPEPGEYCYFAPFISAAISPDPSSQSETLGNDLLRSSAAGLLNCRALLELDGLTPDRLELLKNQYYHYIWLSLSNIGGAVAGEPVRRRLCDKTLEFVLSSLASVPAALYDGNRHDRILSELDGNFLPERVEKNLGARELKRYMCRLKRLKRKYEKQYTNNYNYAENNR